MLDDTHGYQGYFDGYQGGRLHGWAWMPTEPEVRLAIEIYAGGVLIAEAEASQHRPDLQRAGIGDGCFGFAIPCQIDLDRNEVVQIQVRVQNGPVLTGGDAEIGGALGPEDAAMVEAFVAATLGEPGPGGGASHDPNVEGQSNFFVYCPAGQPLAEGDGAYPAIMQAYIPLLRQLGTVHVIDDPLTQVDALYREQIARGETGLLLSFAPLHETVLGLRCPVIPVVTWPYPTIPARVWAGDRRHDWRWVLRQTGRAIATSTFTAAVIRASMGEDFPVALAPPPVHGPAGGEDARQSGEMVVVVDTAPGTPLSSVIERSASTEPFSVANAIGGVVFAAPSSADDEIANWSDIVTAFVAALGDVADAILVLELQGYGTGLWRSEVVDYVRRMPPFSCRLIVLDAAFGLQVVSGPAQAANWVVNASKAESVNMRLMEYMHAGTPVIAPIHTGLCDLITEACALVASSSEETCAWPHDPAKRETTTRHRISWPSLRDSFSQAYGVSRGDPGRHAAMGAAAAARIASESGDAVFLQRLKSFLGLEGANRPRLQAPRAEF